MMAVGFGMMVRNANAKVPVVLYNFSYVRLFEPGKVGGKKNV